MKRKALTFRPTEYAAKWLTEQSKERGLSKNDVLLELINEKMSVKTQPERRENYERFNRIEV